MTVNFQRTERTLLVLLSGDLNTNTAPDFLTQVQEQLRGISELHIDLKDTEYCSSAGLRALLELHKQMAQVGSMTLYHANDSLKDVFDYTGLDGVFSIK